MRRAWAAVGALALIVGGCSHTGEPGQGEDQMTRTPTREEVFIEQAHESVPESREVSDDDLVGYGEATCAALRSGATVAELGQVVGSKAPNDEVAMMLGQLGGIAARTLCPRALENGG